MTGIERLRELIDGISPITAVVGVTKTSYDRKHVEETGHRLRDFLADIADQIERERTCDADAIENVRLIVGGVIDEMDRHISGVEGMDDSPVARWARELRDALGGEGHDLTDEDREAIAWVREHGGLEKIIQQRRDSVPRAAYERKLGKRLRHIAECEEALRRRNVTISALEKAANLLRKQIADSAVVCIGHAWLTSNPPSRRLGRPLREGETVWVVNDPHDALRVIGECYDGDIKLWSSVDDCKIYRDPSQLTHERPDSWEQLEKDANAAVCTYFGAGVKDCESCDHHSWECSYDKALDIVRRAKALAERDA